LRALENRMLRRIFGTKMAELTGGWRKFCNEELHKSHSSPNIIIMIKSWRSHERVMQKEWEKKNVHRYVGKP
jgi:hypothetical protein